ncbi:fungal-specific transcription factor domain-containing protein [Mycena rosella]|uniref:Fungal-specific transcription factor domain-containing protein n=1 Tax=Mycena rosella TaxID=1033263 RepID=A0AAD7GDQ2_MYCRO|nr:fungal-specific transcription factor domain-containing protein [Mycena rosella]
MPVDTTGKTPASARRAPRRPATEEEQKDIELKRLRGELSCAECRRLKLKCDKNVPCGSCVRRGCESICPCGILSAGQGTRFILADTDQLHAKIAEMSQRIRQLEEALAILQNVVSNERHPLLAGDLLGIKFAAEAPKRSDPAHYEQDSAIDALGTLTLGDAGEVKYFGRSAGTETLLAAEDYSDEEDDASSTEAPLPPDVAEIGDVFPCGRPSPAKLQHILTLLPPYARATALCADYLAHGSLFFRPIKRDELLGPFLQSIYAPEDDSSTEPHALATLFFVLALGALLDLRLPPYNTEAERFYGAGRAALGLRAAYDSPLVDTVRAIGLMATYHSLAGKSYSRDSAWCLMSLAAKLAQSIGLHRDSARWHMDPKTVQKRRTLFWDVFTADVSHSLALGRPPVIHLSYVDCEYPEDEECTLTELGEIRPGFWRSKYHFARDIWMALAETTLTAKVPGYATVLELDRRVRELSVPDSFKPYATRADGEEEYYSSAASLRGFYASQYRTITMIYLHRSFFAQAMLDFPANPLRSPFATSFLTAYRSASVIIKATAYQFDRCAEMAMRVWFLLHHTFSAAIIAGTVVTLSPKSNMASSALLDLGLAVDLFQRTATQSHRAKLASAVLSKLRERAVRAYTQYSSPPPPTAGPGPTVELPEDDTDATDELAIFGGQKRVLALKQKQKHRRSKSKSVESPDGGVGGGGFPATPDNAYPGMGAPYEDTMGGAAQQPLEEFPWLDDLVALNPQANANVNINLNLDNGSEGMHMAGMPANLYDMMYFGDAGADPGQPYAFGMEGGGGGDGGGNGSGGPEGQGTGAMVELGLTSESGMDAAWLAFIQQCGVTLGSPVDADELI